MTNLRQTQLMHELLSNLIKKIGSYTSRGFATNLIAKAILDLRDENECFNYVLINETRYEEGINAFTVSEDINGVYSYEFYSALKNLIEVTMKCFDNQVDIHFLNELRKDLPDIFYFIDNLDSEKRNFDKKQVMIVDDNKKLVDLVVKGFNNITEEYEFTEANSGVQCFDLLTSGYTPEIIILSYMMPDEKSKQIFTRIKNNELWKNIPLILITKKDDSINEDLVKKSNDDCISLPFELVDLKKRIDQRLSIKN
jgi:CheY-like chemotaxis protein